MRAAIAALVLAGCAGGEGEWVVETWGEDYIEREIPAEAFADGCSATFDTFLVSLAARQLLDGDGAIVGELPPIVEDLTVPGPSASGSATVPADHYSLVRMVVGADPGAEPGTASADQVSTLAAAGASVLVEGTLRCPSGEVSFSWAFDDTTVYACEPPDLTIPAGGSDRTELTFHGDHLFYDALQDPEASVRGEPLIAADADGDGVLGLDELEAVSVPALGYDVGGYADVLTLRAFVAHLARTIGHVDGEAECLVDL